MEESILFKCPQDSGCGWCQKLSNQRKKDEQDILDKVKSIKCDGECKYGCHCWRK
jgi:hypothetical protein